MANLDAIFDGVIEESLVKPPVSVLKELARELEKITKGLLVGKVEQTVRDSWVTLEFYITAPSLNNYSYQVFTITHDLYFYPLKINQLNEKSFSNAGNEEELEARLKTIFSLPEVKRVINGLLAQIKSA
jgi:hypothetical protein